MRFLFFATLLALARTFQLDDPLSYTRVNAVVQGKNYSYIDEGPRNGRVIMLMHGFPESWFLFKHQIKLCVGLGYRVVGLDMLGYGQSDAPTSLDPYTYPAITKDIKELLEESVGVKSAIFLAHDWGSMFMWYLAVDYPQIVDGLISLCIPIFTPSLISYTLETLATKVPQVRYQLSIANSNTTKLDLDIRGFLTSFFSVDPLCMAKMSVSPPRRRHC
ncbi:hypothetical protein DSO57_1008848 [Entomophthora muscae]|uniref:Uncharacterized protein n=1 Tax=Entomophthora muscae TaxID=34485 RepID=A0ACC2S9A8_9FUNG|nr:hypothetical protein DSO57_1008848 [Entomophthora muscae]